MSKIRIIILLTVLISPLSNQAQNKYSWNVFTDYVDKSFVLPESLKQNCEWMYAIVRVRTNTSNQIISYEFINDPPTGLKKSFAFLTGYQFPKNMKINRHPIVFYLGIDNLNICKEKPGDFIYYAPNQVVNIFTTYIEKIQKEDPKTIFINKLIFKDYYPTQR